MLQALLNSGDLITPSELAKGLKVSRAAVSQWCKRGELPFIQLGKSIRFEPDSIREWLQAKRRGRQNEGSH
jgi:excisionase family DNA binding protein